MPQDRRRPQPEINEPKDASAQQRRLQLVPQAEVKTPDRSARLADEVMRFLRTNGFDCSVAVEAAEALAAEEDDTPRTLH